MLITFAQAHSGHRPGDTAEVDDAAAAQLIYDGLARPAHATAGTVAAILRDVGDDPVKARAALDAELAKASQRSSLVDQLTKLVDSNAGDGTEQGGPA